MKRSSRERGHEPPNFSREQFVSWAISQKNWEVLWVNYQQSSFDRMLRPSVDRLNNSIGYSFRNIRLVTWRENLSAYTKTDRAIANLNAARKKRKFNKK